MTNMMNLVSSDYYAEIARQGAEALAEAAEQPATTSASAVPVAPAVPPVTKSEKPIFVNPKAFAPTQSHRRLFDIRRKAMLALSATLILLFVAKMCTATYREAAAPLESLDSAAPRTHNTPHSPFTPQTSQLSKRDISCEDVHSAPNACEFVRAECRDEHIGFFDYLSAYYCGSRADKVFVAIGMFGFLAALFLTLGLAASDFLCPNLNCISVLLGMSESLAGVTFLAFGNGSPDVFSTYAAMKIGSGSLAVGELLGAAAFISGVVAGSMSIVAPFRVARKSFVRDVAFFLAAVALVLACIGNGRLTLAKCGIMLVFYAVYVVFVVGWQLVGTRRRRRYLVDAKARDLYVDAGTEREIERDEEIVDDEADLLAQRIDLSALEAEFAQTGPQDGERDEERLDGPKYWPQNTELGSQQLGEAEDADRGYWRLAQGMSLSGDGAGRRNIRPSLLGALEFRSVLQGLGENLTGGRPAIGLAELEGENAVNAESGESGESGEGTEETREAGEAVEAESERESELDSLSDEPRESSEQPRWRKWLRKYSKRGSAAQEHNQLDAQLEHLELLGQTAAEQRTLWWHVLFPTIVNFRQASVPERISRAVSAPFVLLLTISVPVGDVGLASRGAGVALSGVAQEEERKPGYWLVWLQAAVGPIIVAFLLFFDRPLGGPLLAGAAVAAVLTPITVAFTRRGLSRRVQRGFNAFVCFWGFFVSITWISAIANEVVGILKAVGVISGISDAILGLTVFALGNSLGDLVADITIARMGFPMMALCACFGGPMLNILVGIGFSGTAVLLSRDFGLGDFSYRLELSISLVVTAVTLVVILVFLLVAVALNGWVMNRKIGAVTVGLWAIGTVINLIIEVVG